MVRGQTGLRTVHGRLVISRCESTSRVRCSWPRPGNVTARALAPMRVTLEWDRTLPSLTGTIDWDDGYKIEWSADGNAPWTSLVNVTNQYVTDSDIWCVCFPTRFNDDTITPGTTRHYRIKAVDDDDESAWSEVVSATTPELVDSDGGLILVGGVKSELDALNDQKDVPNRPGERGVPVQDRRGCAEAPGDRDRSGRHGDRELRAGGGQRSQTENHGEQPRPTPGQDFAWRGFRQRRGRASEGGIVPVPARAGERPRRWVRCVCQPLPP